MKSGAENLFFLGKSRKPKLISEIKNYEANRVREIKELHISESYAQTCIQEVK